MTRRYRSGSRSGTGGAKTGSVPRSDRGQTTQDFAVGIGIFILTVAFVFMYVPSLSAPHESSISGAETAQADRIADRIVENASTERPNELNATTFKGNYTGDSEELVATLGLRASKDASGDVDAVFDRVNVTVERLDGTPVGSNWNGGHTYGNQSAASSARIVTVDDSIDCEPACRLIVRVW
ncbi:DUF7287 family protein [Halosolutus gelatinilyticus]|uniref:DUF7287 family protein n=1 Tax=Halosolutus gelatinilyticus TaxID=2931975 RepID=UPI001FF5B6BF|nr:hypothetical protein [Halosolutus gelatinilyticus]